MKLSVNSFANVARYFYRKILTPESQLKKSKAQQKSAEQIAADRKARKTVC